MSEEQRVKVKVEIMGKEFRFISNPDTPIEYIHKIAGYVDEQMRKISQQQPTLDIPRVAILASVNISDEYFKLQNECDQLKRQLEENKLKEQELMKELDDLREQRVKWQEANEQDQTWKKQYESVVQSQREQKAQFVQLQEEYEKLQKEFNDWLKMMEEEN